MDTTANTINWFEIPALDINRAKTFYESIFSISMDRQEMGGMQMAFFPYEIGNGKISGALVQGELHKPSADGAVIYLNANPNLEAVANKIEAAGGKLIMPKTPITEEIGYMAFFIDTEGNRVALHSQG